MFICVHRNVNNFDRFHFSVDNSLVILFLSPGLSTGKQAYFLTGASSKNPKKTPPNLGGVLGGYKLLGASGRLVLAFFPTDTRGLFPMIHVVMVCGVLVKGFLLRGV